MEGDSPANLPDDNDHDKHVEPKSQVCFCILGIIMDLIDEKIEEKLKMISNDCCCC